MLETKRSLWRYRSEIQFRANKTSETSVRYGNRQTSRIGCVLK